MPSNELTVPILGLETLESKAHATSLGLELIPRFFYPVFASEEGLAAVKDFVHRMGIAEVMLFTASLQADANYLTDAEIAQRCARIRYVISELAMLGVSSSINVEGTLGHHSGSRDVERFPFRAMMDLSGATSDACACPLDEWWRAYVQRLYGALAATGARKIFVDDDFRYGWHIEDGGTVNTFWDTCFCDEHLRRFGEMVDRTFTREELGRELSSGDAAVRQAWFEFKSGTLLDIADLLRRAVHSVDPNCRLGLMNTFTANARRDRDLHTLLLRLAGPHRPLLRPAQGYYSDRDRLGLLYGLGETLAAMEAAPPDTEIVVEVDGGTPYNRFNKASRVLFDLQAKANIGCGMTNLSLNVFDDCEPANFITSEHRMYLENGAANALERVVGSLPQGGKLLGAGMVAGRGPFFPDPPHSDYNLQREAMVTLWRLGIPVTMGESAVRVLSHGSVQSTDLDALFDGSGVLVDLFAARDICEMGRADLLGISGVEEIGAYSREVLSDHPLNAGGAGSHLGIGHCIPRSQVGKLLTDGSDPACLGRIIGFQGEDLGPSAVVLEQGKRRVVTLAYSLAATGAFVTFARKNQMFRMLRWLSRDAIPVLVNGTADVVPFMIYNGESCVLSLVNLSLDTAADFSLSFAGDLRFSSCREIDGPARRVVDAAGSGRLVVEGLSMEPISIAQFVVQP